MLSEETTQCFMPITVLFVWAENTLKLVVFDVGLIIEILRKMIQSLIFKNFKTERKISESLNK